MSSRNAHPAPRLQCGFVDVSALSGPQYIKQSCRVAPPVVNFYKFIEQCRLELPDFPHLGGCQNKDLLKNIDKFRQIFPSILPELTAYTEGLHRNHRRAHQTMIEAICSGAELHAVCVLSRQQKGRQLHRYDDCFLPLQNVLSYPPSRNGRAKLPPVYIFEGSKLESALVDCIGDIAALAFDYMKWCDKQDDQVSYLIENALHMATSEGVFVPSVAVAAKKAFQIVYRDMSDEEKRQVTSNCHYIKCEQSRSIIDKWLLEIVQEDAAVERREHFAAVQLAHAFVAK